MDHDMGRLPGNGAIYVVIALAIAIGVFSFAVHELAPTPGLQAGTAAK